MTIDFFIKFLELCIHNPNLVLEPSTTPTDPSGQFAITSYFKHQAKGTDDLLTVFIDLFLLETSDKWNRTT